MDAKARFIRDNTRWIKRRSKRSSEYIPKVDRSYCVSEESLKGVPEIEQVTDILMPFKKIDPKTIRKLGLAKEQATGSPEDHLSSMACMMDFLQDPDAKVALIIENGAAVGDIGAVSEAIEQAVNSGESMVLLGDAGYVLDKNAAEMIVTKSLPISAPGKEMMRAIMNTNEPSKNLVKRIYTEKMDAVEDNAAIKPSVYIPIIVFVALLLGFLLLYIIDKRRQLRVRNNVNSPANLLPVT